MPSTGVALVQLIQQFRQPTGVVELIRKLAQTQQASGNQDRQKNGDGHCSQATRDLSYFGLCGPGEFTPGNVATTECYGHDYCVCAYGHSSCTFNVPQDCGEEDSVWCYSLYEAAASYFGDLWATFWNWFNAELEDEEDERNMSIT